ncbi:hypothetical protein C9374_001019 [Naegleria lovaniensis]|uniref:NmrA-like domain-containing protein n=1 Tax=Naegleria lovaniensis TaxID=51637 RepID=A0AA88GXZ9_NAELO|nr:uncharacterized protein C9374_001019 [Naegleria lovaniensis]KAG2388169.1 hypothetical protein C9374_001019 [Naegleria lovaniensis]
MTTVIGSVLKSISITQNRTLDVFVTGATGNVGMEVLKCLLSTTKKNATKTNDSEFADAEPPLRRRSLNIYAGVRQLNASTLSKFHKELFNNDPSVRIVDTSSTNEPVAIFKKQDQGSSSDDDEAILLRLIPFDFKQHGGGEVFQRVLEGNSISEYLPKDGGFHRLFLMRPPDLSNIQRDMKPFLEFITHSRPANNNSTTTYLPEQIVFMSVLGAENNKFIPHYKIEQILKEHSQRVPYVFLRPSFFMQNLTTTHLKEIRDDSQLFMPAGNGSTSFIDVRDIAQAAARILTEENAEKYANKAFDLTGSEALTYFEVAKKLSDACGRTIVYANPSIPKFMFRTWKSNPDVPFTYVMVVTALYAGKFIVKQEQYYYI